MIQSCFFNSLLDPLVRQCDIIQLLSSVLYDAPTSGFLILSKHEKCPIKHPMSQNVINRRLNRMFSWHLYYIWIIHFKGLLQSGMSKKSSICSKSLNIVVIYCFALDWPEQFQARLHSCPKIPTGIWQGWGHRRQGDKSEEPTREVSDLDVAERTHAKNSHCGFVIYKPCHIIIRILRYNLLEKCLFFFVWSSINNPIMKPLFTHGSFASKRHVNKHMYFCCVLLFQAQLLHLLLSCLLVLPMKPPQQASSCLRNTPRSVSKSNLLCLPAFALCNAKPWCQAAGCFLRQTAWKKRLCAGRTG